MFNISAGIEYVLPPPPRGADIPAVASIVPYKRPGRDSNRKRDGSKSKKRDSFKELFDKEVEAQPGQMGSFIEYKV